MAHRLAVVMLAILLVSAISPSSAIASSPPGTYFQGFEKNTSGWDPGADRGIVREPSGYTNGPTGYATGISSAAGKWHARLPDLTGCTQSCDGPFTRWGGYTMSFPEGGYLTQLDIYLDVGWAATHADTRFDWISAINDSNGNFLRDFVFNVGTLGSGYIVQSSTNSTRSGANPYFPCPAPNTAPNTCRPPATINASGWYTFRHTFRDNAGNLAVDFDIIQQSTNTSVAHWTISADPISTVGGNRYGWFSNEEIPDLAIDDTLRTNFCHEGDGDGDVDHGQARGHFRFHKNSCNDKDEGASEDDNSNHFESSSVDSSTFTYDENSQTLTMAGTGLDNGLPVAYTLVAIDNGDVAPALYTLTLSDGRIVSGPVVDGVLQVQ